MNPFVCLFDRSGEPVGAAQLGRLAEPLVRRGGALSTFRRGAIGIALVHDPAIPESRRLHGPLEDSASGLVVAVAGRFSELGEGASDTGPLPYPAAGGAATALAAAIRGEAEYLGRVAGAFVVVAADPARPLLSLSRDHLGSRKLFYYLDGRWLVAASQPEAILKHRALSDALDERAAARFLGFQFSHGERSFFRQIRELPPAHRLRVTGGDSRLESYWRFHHREVTGHDAPGLVAAAFRDHLRRSIAHQLTDLAPRRVALSLSGGLDSTSLAALAPRDLRSFSWTFDEVTEGDERRRVGAVAEHLGIDVQEVPGDGCLPLAGDFVERFVHRGSPYVNPFAALKSRLYAAARDEGCRRVLVGDGGDALYAAREYWLRDALADRRPGAAAALARTVRAAVRGDRFCRLALRRLLPPSRLRRRVPEARAPWLTAEGRSLLPPPAASPILPPGGSRRRFDLCAGSRHSELESEEVTLFAQCGVDRGNPFWHWPLLEMVASLPAWWYHWQGEAKVLTRKALQGRLPDEVLQGERRGLLGAFFLRGIERRRQELRLTLFRRPSSDWQRFVDRAWLEPYLEATAAIRFGHTILWRVIGYELWQRRLAGTD